MLIREYSEMLEIELLSEYAAKSKYTRGRKIEETKCDIRTDFQRDRDRIIHCKAFRRLKHKTQVFISPEGDHYRTRLTHTLEVAQIARTIARALRLNEDLTEAIAIGHDLGHTPFGHTGEQILNEISPKGFAHAQQSVKVVEILEKNGNGLNLTYEVIDGIQNHTGEDKAFTLEGRIVKFADRIAYINHDIDDAIRAGIITEESLPKYAIETLGSSHSNRINYMIKDIIKNSIGINEIRMDNETLKAMMELRQYMFDYVYIGSKAKNQDEKAKRLICLIYQYFVKHLDELPEEYKNLIEIQGKEVTVCDYIAGMSDKYAVHVFNKIYIPKAWDNV